MKIKYTTKYAVGIEAEILFLSASAKKDWSGKPAPFRRGGLGIRPTIASFLNKLKTLKNLTKIDQVF